MSPSVREASPDEAPVVLEKVEVSTGNFIKMSPADRDAHFARVAETERSRAEYAAALRGEVTAPDGGPEVVPLTILTKPELVGLAKSRGLVASGSKDAIAARFAAGTESDDQDPDDDDQDDEDQESA